MHECINCGKLFSTYGKLQYGKNVENFFPHVENCIVEKMLKSFHMWKTYVEKWKTCGKLCKEKMHKKSRFFVQKVEQKFF